MLSIDRDYEKKLSYLKRCHTESFEFINEAQEKIEMTKGEYYKLIDIFCGYFALNS